MMISYGRDLLMQWKHPLMPNVIHCNKDNVLPPGHTDREITHSASVIPHRSRALISSQAEINAEANINGRYESVYQRKQKKTNLKPAITLPSLSTTTSQSKERKSYVFFQPAVSPTDTTGPGLPQQDLEEEAGATKTIKLRKTVTWASDVLKTPELLVKQTPKPKKKKKKRKESPPAISPTKMITRPVAATAAADEAQRVAKVFSKRDLNSNSRARITATGRVQKPSVNKDTACPESPNVVTKVTTSALQTPTHKQMHKL